MTLTRVLLAILAVLALAPCAGSDAPHGKLGVTPPIVDAPVAAVPIDAPAAEPAPDAPPPVAVVPEVWLKGSTHVHAKPSGDSSTPIPEVIDWYRTHGYDFFVLTDHNQVSEAEKGNDTHGKPAILEKDIIVLAGVELTNNPSDCVPRGEGNKCRIHVCMLGVTGRPGGRIEWAERKSHARLDKYNAALVAGQALGGIAQMNHPNWTWGTNADLLVELSRRGLHHVEIANAQFPKWNAGDKDHPSMEALWDAALARGATIWGMASDDAHDYGPRGKYRAGGGWVVVRARREPQAIVDSLAAGRFYASNGVVLEHAEVDAATRELYVEVASGEAGTYTIDFIENGANAQTVRGRSARRSLPASGYVRAVVTREDGTAKGQKAWVQPARR